MGSLAKIEHDKTASAAFTGCAPVDWMIQKAGDFAKWVGKGAYDFVAPFVGEIGYFFKGLGESIGEILPWIKNNIPGVDEAKKLIGGAGSFIANGIKAAIPCLKTFLTGVAVAGAVGLVGGGLYLAVIGGELATIAAALTLGVFAKFAIRSVARAYQFNWNITDAEISNRYKSSINALASQAGSVVGSGLAAIACGAGGSALVLRINPTAIAACEEAMGEAFDEWKSNANALLRQTWASVTQWATLELYRNVRSALKKAAKNPAIAKFLPKQVQEAIAYWGSPNAKPWSFALAVEKAGDNIPYEWLKSFVEEAREEFADVCSEATYALSYGL